MKQTTELLERFACRGCRAEFSAPASENRKYCSKECYELHGRGTHQRCKSPEWRSWNAMRARCNQRTHKNYDRYGGRGITVHPEWDMPRVGFTAFLSHIGPMPEPGMTLDRIDNNAGYIPGNVRWATRNEQSQNTSHTVLVTIDADTLSMSAWCRRLGLCIGTVYYRIRKLGMTHKEAILATAARRCR